MLSETKEVGSAMFGAQAFGEKAMKYSICALFLLFTALPLQSYAQTSLNDSLRQMELDAERSRLRSQQFEADMARSRAESDRSNAEFARLTADLARMKAEKDANAAADKAEAAARESEERRIETERVARVERERLQQEGTLAAVKTKNTLYLFAFALAIGFFVGHIVKTKQRGGIMKDDEKFGLVVIFASLLLAIFSLILSSGWYPNADFLTNFMGSLSIQFLADEDTHYPTKYLIDIPTKYLVFLFMCSGTYGFTTYLGITPALHKKKVEAMQEHSEST